ncbi:MAG: OmpH family outer membrane protein [Alphaproteobacteria bacterium]
MKHPLFAAALLLTLLAAPPLKAEPLAPPKVAIVDIDQLSAQSKATQSLTQQVDAEIAAFRNEMAFKYESLQEELRTLRVESVILTPQAQAEQQASLEERVNAIQAEEAEGIAAIEARGAAAFETLQDGFSESVQLVAESLEVDMILQAPVYQTLVADNLIAPGAEDVTGVVLLLLDNKYPTVDLPPAGNAR